jgi:histidinol-phosphatase (PHP family)
MLDSNYHTHSCFCDGVGELEDYVLTAIQRKMKCLGFSGHAPIPYNVTIMKQENLQKYMDEVNFLKQKYKDKIQILLGLEIDYIPKIISPSDEKYKNLDFKIGSIHYVDFFKSGIPYAVDLSEESFLKGLKEIFSNDLEKLCTRYYELLREMIRTNSLDIVGHLDKIKRYNNFPEESLWYRKEIIYTLEEIKKTNVIIEINTRSLYKEKKSYLYPSEWIIKLIKDFNIPIVINSDAHSPNELQERFDYVFDIIKKIGFKKTDKSLNPKLDYNIFV